MTQTFRTRRGLCAALAGLTIGGLALAGCSSSGGSSHASTPASTVVTSTAAAADHTHSAPAAATKTPDVAAETGLYAAMRQLWAQHMAWTYATVDAFFHDQNALKPTLARLLQNQHDIGAAVVPYYGKAAGDKLTTLLLAHINDAVPVLQAAKAGDSAALTKATDEWYANAKQIAGLLSSANPTNWPTSATEPMMKEHITQTIAYSVDLLKGDYAKSITEYDKAEAHMAMMADTLSSGIIAQFPEKFTS